MHTAKKYQVHPLLLMSSIDHPTAQIITSLCVVTCPSKWYFHFDEQLIIARTHLLSMAMFQYLPLPVVEYKGSYCWRCQGSPSPLPMGDMEHPPYSPNMSPCDYDLFAKMRDTLPHKGGDYLCCGVVTPGHQRKWTHWWYTTPSINLAEGGSHGDVTMLEECVFTSGNKAISEL
jgi:hypothetical protein